MFGWISNGQTCLNNGVPTLDCIPGLIHFVINLAFALAGAVSLVLLIIAGIRFSISQGGKQAEEAKNMATYAIIGLLVVLFSFIILQVIANITNAKCILNVNFSSCS